MTRQRGFTLVEVLTALVIFAIAATALVSSVSQSTVQLRQIEERQFAALTAHNRMLELYLGGIPAKRFGRASNGGYDFDWRVDTIPTDTPGIVRVEVFVALPDHDSDRSSLVAFFPASKILKP